MKKITFLYITHYVIAIGQIIVGFVCDNKLLLLCGATCNLIFTLVIAIIKYKKTKKDKHLKWYERIEKVEEKNIQDYYDGI